MSALGLGGYNSSDEEEDIASSVPVQLDEKSGSSEPQLLPLNDQVDGERRSTDNGALISESDQTLGPSLPPQPADSAPSPASDLPDTDPSLSPYSRERQQTRLLTMPPVPNFSIPASPPPADPSTTAVANKKIRHFLTLKRQGVHFNDRLLSSTTLRNPGMMAKLMDFAGIEGPSQYESADEEGKGIDVEKWANIKVEQIVKAMDDRRRAESEGRRGKERTFVHGGVQKARR